MKCQFTVGKEPSFLCRPNSLSGNIPSLTKAGDLCCMSLPSFSPHISVCFYRWVLLLKICLIVWDIRFSWCKIIYSLHIMFFLFFIAVRLILSGCSYIPFSVVCISINIMLLSVWKLKKFLSFLATYFSLLHTDNKIVSHLISRKYNIIIRKT